MALTSIFLAEEALSLPADQRAELAKLLMESLKEDVRSDQEIRKDLSLRLAVLKSGEDRGMSYEEVFGTKD